MTRTVWTPELDEEDREVLELAVTEVERYREMDRLNPSPHNAISIAVMEVRCNMSLFSVILTLDISSVDVNVATKCYLTS